MLTFRVRSRIRFIVRVNFNNSAGSNARASFSTRARVWAKCHVRFTARES
jgi:hypothetical protein